MSTDHRRSAPGRGRATLDQVEIALVDHYTRLVSLAYLTLPFSLGRHRRVLVAHGIVQRALPGFRVRAAARRVPAQRGGDGTGASMWLRERVLRSALRHEHRPRGWPGWLPPPRLLWPALPVIWGLRLFPRAGGAEEAALGQVLSKETVATRAALALRCLDGLPDLQIVRLLRAAGAESPEEALRIATRIAREAGPSAAALLRSREFDACSVQTRPTDLLRRRRRFRLTVVATAMAVLAATALFVTVDAVRPDQEPTATATAGVPGPDDLVRAPADDWADTSRVDLTAWPARGELADDRALLGRALRVWADPPSGTRVDTVAATATEPPGRAPQLLYAGKADGAAVVLFHDADRVVRYSEPAGSGQRAALSFARTDDADVTTAAVLALSRTQGSVRYLTAPWIAEAETRDLLRPDKPGSPLDIGDDGVTDALRSPSGQGGCASWPVLQLRSSDRIVEKHAFLVTDLGALTATHLTYTPLPGDGERPRAPREATSAAALRSWAHIACGLDELRGDDVRAVNQWEFAEQDLPEDAGTAVWSCGRVSSWRGPGDVVIRFQEPGTAPAKAVAQARSTAACSRFGQHVVAATDWRAPSGRSYLLAAGSRDVVRLKVDGAPDTTARGRTLAVRDPEDVRAQVRGELSDGHTLTGVGAGGTSD